MEIPDSHLQLTDANYRELERAINPLRESQYQGVDIYMDTVNFMNEHLQ